MTELSTHIIDSFHASGYPKCVNIRGTQFVSAEIKIANFFRAIKKLSPDEHWCELAKTGREHGGLIKNDCELNGSPRFVCYLLLSPCGRQKNVHCKLYLSPLGQRICSSIFWQRSKNSSKLDVVAVLSMKGVDTTVRKQKTEKFFGAKLRQKQQTNLLHSFPPYSGRWKDMKWVGSSERERKIDDPPGVLN